MDATLAVDEQFHLHFVWKLPSEDFIRAVFQVRIIEIQPHEDRYLVQLETFVAGLQEDETGKARPSAEYDKNWWAHIVALTSRYVQVAYEAADGRPLYMRIGTLTGRHAFFFRYDENGKLLPKPDKDNPDVISD